MAKNWQHNKIFRFQFLKNCLLLIVSEISPGLVPVWLTDSTENVTTHLYIEKPKESGLVTGTQKSPCPLPCSTTHVESRVLREGVKNCQNGWGVEEHLKMIFYTLEQTLPNIWAILKDPLQSQLQIQLQLSMAEFALFPTWSSWLPSHQQGY